MAKLTIGRMANLYGLHRSTLHEAVAKGRVTAGLDGKGQRVIDLSEMIRVYGEPQASSRQYPTLSPDTDQTHILDALHPLLDELRLLREEVRELRETMRLIELKPESIQTQPQNEPPQPQKEPATWASLFSVLDD
jgi:hypothetical protein